MVKRGEVAKSNGREIRGKTDYTRHTLLSCTCLLLIEDVTFTVECVRGTWNILDEI